VNTGSRRGGEPERLGEILARVLEESKLFSRREQEDLVEAWRDVAGPDVAVHTTVRTFKRGVLTVSVDSAPLLQELTIYMRDELLLGLRERLGGLHVEELRFRLV